MLFMCYALLAVVTFFLSGNFIAAMLRDDGRNLVVTICPVIPLAVVAAFCVICVIRNGEHKIAQKAGMRICFRLTACFFTVIILAALPYMLIVPQVNGALSSSSVPPENSASINHKNPFLIFAGLAVFLLPLWCVVLAIGAHFAATLSAFVVEMNSAIQKVAEGDYSVKIHSRYRDEPGNLAYSFNTMVQKLERSQAALIRAGNMSVWQNLAQQLAHEIKNPLTPIKLSAERMLRRYQNDPEHLHEIFEASVNVIIKEVDNLTALLDEFRILSRPIETKNAATSLSAVLDECVSIFAATYPDIRFSTDAVDSTLTIAIDGHHLRQVLNNLMINAIDAMNTKGNIKISARPVNSDEGLFAQITIADSGEGIDDDAKDKIFTPYWTSKTTGTGLGLPIVEHIVRDYGGNITFDSAKGGGTTFIILLPTKKGYVRAIAKK
jgi:nitrogen fixation/metabolism regulation signal transduction histidine kinase